MKAIGIVGSPRKNGNTEILTKHTLKAIAEEGLETELIRLAGLDIRPCNACMVCRQEVEKPCPIEDDLLPIYEKMKEADAIILASPVYFGSATALLKALIERTGYMSSLRRTVRGEGRRASGGRPPGREELYLCRDHVLVSHHGDDYARFDLLECGHWPGEGGGEG